MKDVWSARGERLLAAGKYAAASKAFRLAAGRSPENAPLQLRVSDCAFLSGDAAGAAKAAARAHEIAGGPDFLRRRVQAALLAGDEAAARKALIEEGASGAEAAFWRGVLACRAGKWRQARTEFIAAVNGDPERLAVRAGLLAAWAGHRAAGVPESRRGRGIIIAGLGWKRPRQATVGALDALSACRTILAVANTINDDVRDVLCLYRAKIRAVAFRGTEKDAAGAADAALRAADGGQVGTITRGNPLVYGRFAARLVAGAKRRKIPVRVLPGVSAFEGLAAEARPLPRTPLGVELRGGHAAEDADPKRPLLIFAPNAESGRKTLAAALPRLARGKKVRVLTSEGPSAAASELLSAREAANALRGSGAPAMLWLEPRK